MRLSDGTGVPQVPDNNPAAAPRGMAIRFNLAGGAITDIVAKSHNGFFVGTGEDFLALVTAGNNAFVFVDSAGTRRAGRYQIIPVAGPAILDSVAASRTTPNYLFDDLPRRVARGPIQYRLYVQLANPGDPTNDGSIVWPDHRKRVELGTLSLTAIAPDTEALQRKLMYTPILLTNGIELSDDPFPVLRAAVYALSTQHRQ